MKSPGSTGRELLASGLSRKEALALTSSEEGVLPFLQLGPSSPAHILLFRLPGLLSQLGLSSVFSAETSERLGKNKVLKCLHALTR